jgi:coiled-coil domain-containing protein 55
MKLSLAGSNKPGLQKGKQPTANKTATTTASNSSKNAFGQVKSSSTSSSKKPAIFGDDDDDEEEDESRKVDIGGKPLSKLEQRKQADPSRLAQGLRGSQTTTTTSSPSTSTTAKGTTPSASNNSRILAKMHAEAQAIDPSVFSYDEVYDSMKHAQKAALDARKAEKEAEGDAPKYVSGLLKAAELRKKDRIRAEDKLIERERQKEGDEFEDKDAFVTQAYKDQQVELRKLEEDEQKKEGESALFPFVPLLSITTNWQSSLYS